MFYKRIFSLKAVVLKQAFKLGSTNVAKYPNKTGTFQKAGGKIINVLTIVSDKCFKSVK